MFSILVISTYMYVNKYGDTRSLWPHPLPKLKIQKIFHFELHTVWTLLTVILLKINIITWFWAITFDQVIFTLAFVNVTNKDTNTTQNVFLFYPSDVIWTKTWGATTIESGPRYIYFLKSFVFSDENNMISSVLCVLSCYITCDAHIFHINCI